MPTAEDRGSFDAESEYDSPETIAALVDALRAGGHTVHLVEADGDAPRWFLTHAVDAVVNIAEGACGAHRESYIPAILELLQIPFTGSGSLTLALALDKARTKQVLASEGIPTPPWQLVTAPQEPLDPTLRFPLIVKPNAEGSGKGISAQSVVWNEAALRRQIEWVLDRYRQEALVEEFIDGTEVTVGVLGTDDARVLPMLEIDFTPCRRFGEAFYSWRMKEYQGCAVLGLAPAFHCPARLSPELTAAIQAVALRAHRVLGCRDLSRTDIRVGHDGTPFVLEINPLPGLHPTDSNFPFMTTAAGIAYPAFINRLVEMALARECGGAQAQESLGRPPAARSDCAPAVALVESPAVP